MTSTIIRSLLSRSRSQIISKSYLNGNNKLTQFSNIYNRLSHTNNYLKKSDVQQDVMPTLEEQLTLTRGIIGNVNEQITSKSHGRLFAVVMISGRQHLITTEDLLAHAYDFPPTVGDKIRFEKVMAVGGSDFTLHGRPLLPKDLVYIEAVVVEKTMGATEVKIRYSRKALKFRRPTLAVIRITEIRFGHLVDGHPSVEGVEGRIF